MRPPFDQKNAAKKQSLLLCGFFATCLKTLRRVLFTIEISPIRERFAAKSIDKIKSDAGSFFIRREVKITF
jgi:hypothetical protein